MTRTTPSLQRRGDALHVVGTVTLETVSALEKAVASLSPDFDCVDLGEVGQIDSAGLAWLASLAASRQTEDCRLTVRRAPPSLRTLAQLYETEFLVFSEASSSA